MVKAVQAEDAVSDHFDALLKDRCPAQVGLLVGKPSVGSRDLVLAVVSHPEGDEVLSISSSGTPGAPIAKKGGAAAAAGKGSSSSAAVSIVLRHEDLADHALQVMRMLPGGLAVLGLYLFAPDSGFSSATPALCKALCSIATDLASFLSPSSSTTASAAASAADNNAQEQQELLLLHVDSTSRKFTVKSCLASSGEHAAAASLKPCELKFGPCLASLVCLRARHTFDLALQATQPSAQLQQLLQQAVAQESARVMAGVAVLAGCIPVSNTQPLADLLAETGGSSNGNAAGSITRPVHVDLYCSPPAATAAAASSTENGSSTSSSSVAAVAGSSRLHGTVEAIAYVHKRDTASKALRELKQDVTRSLTARLQLLENETVVAAHDAQEAQQAAAAAAQGAKGAAATAAKPAHPLLAEAGTAGRTSRGLLRRVLLPWEGLSGVQLCDYLLEGDTAAAAVEQAQHLLGLSGLQPGQVTAAEAAALLAQQPTKGAAGHSGGAGGAAGCGPAVAAAATAAVAAAVGVAMAYLSLGQ